MTKEITALMIVEMMGRPKEHLIEMLDKHISKLSDIKNIKLISKKISDAKKVDEEKDMYSCYAEVEVEVPDLPTLTSIVFDFMPSSIEIVDPSNLEMNCQDATMLLNDLTTKLHRYDEIAKLAQLKIYELTNALQKYSQIQIVPNIKSEESKSKKKGDAKSTKKK